MFFTKAGFVIAWLLFIPSAAAYAIMTVSIWTGTTAAVAEVFGERFFASHGTAAEAIAISVAFGTLSCGLQGFLGC